MEDSIKALDEELVRKARKDPRGKYCHIKGCKDLGAFYLIPGNQLLCKNHEPKAHFKGGLSIPDDYFQWKDEEEWKTV